MKHAHTSSDMSKVRSDVLSIPVAFVVPFPLLNPNWSPPRTSPIFVSALLSILAIIFSVFAMRLTFGYVNRRQPVEFFRFYWPCIRVQSCKRSQIGA
jgi:hypothetical protein